MTRKNNNQKNEDQNLIKKLNEIKYWGIKLKFFLGKW